MSRRPRVSAQHAHANPSGHNGLDWFGWSEGGGWAWAVVGGLLGCWWFIGWIVFNVFRGLCLMCVCLCVCVNCVRVCCVGTYWLDGRSRTQNLTPPVAALLSDIPRENSHGYSGIGRVWRQVVTRSHTQRERSTRKKNETETQDTRKHARHTQHTAL